MKLKLILLALVLALAACKKEDPELPPPPCELDNWGNIHVKNYQDYRFSIYMNGNHLTTIGPMATADFAMYSAGFYRVEVKNEDTGLWSSSINDFEVKQCTTNLLPVIF